MDSHYKHQESQGKKKKCQLQKKQSIASYQISATKVWITTLMMSYVLPHFEQWSNTSSYNLPALPLILSALSRGMIMDTGCPDIHWTGRLYYLNVTCLTCHLPRWVTQISAVRAGEVISGKVKQRESWAEKNGWRISFGAAVKGMLKSKMRALNCLPQGSRAYRIWCMNKSGSRYWMENIMSVLVKCHSCPSWFEKSPGKRREGKGREGKVRQGEARRGKAADTTICWDVIYISNMSFSTTDVI